MPTWDNLKAAKQAGREWARGGPNAKPNRYHKGGAMWQAFETACWEEQARIEEEKSDFQMQMHGLERR